MGYIYLCIALISGAIKGFCGKKTSSLTSTFYHSVLANLIRMSFCIIIGFAVVCSEGNFNLLLPDADVLLIALISGISTAVFVVSWLVSVRRNAYMLMDVFLMLGVLVPLTLGQLLFNEAVRPVQWLGLGILFAATLIMCSYNNSIKTKLTFPAFSLLFLCALPGTHLVCCRPAPSSACARPLSATALRGACRTRTLLTRGVSPLSLPCTAAWSL